MMFRLAVLVTVYFAASADAWTDRQILDTISKTCPVKNYMCPKPEFGTIQNGVWVWDEEAILRSPIMSLLRRVRHPDPNTIEVIRSTFCCIEGECLYRCGIFPRTEIDLIRLFPENAKSLFELNMPELETHREFVTEWINNGGKGSPAELEDFFDTVHTHQNKIRKQLAAQKPL